MPDTEVASAPTPMQLVCKPMAVQLLQRHACTSKYIATINSLPAIKLLLRRYGIPTHLLLKTHPLDAQEVWDACNNTPVAQDQPNSCSGSMVLPRATHLLLRKYGMPAARCSFLPPAGKVLCAGRGLQYGAYDWASSCAVSSTATSVRANASVEPGSWK